MVQSNPGLKVPPNQGSSDSIHTPQTTSFASLPEELVLEIAEHLTAEYALGSLASLNVTCRTTREATLSTLYRSLILVTRDPKGFAEQERELELDEARAVPRGWAFVK